MIHTVSGDILLTRAETIAHGIAPNDPFDRGLARALRERWPAMHKDYRHWANTHKAKPGDLWAWGGHGIRIVNLLTQEGDLGHGTKPGRATVEHVNHALRELRHHAEKEGCASIALPRLATGVGGLDWADVKPLVEHHLGDLEAAVYVYETYVPGQQAEEPGLVATG